jgi:hypothetical protein
MRFSANKVALLTTLTVFAGLALAAGSFWYVVLRDGAPAAVSLSGAVNSIASPTAGTRAAGDSPDASPRPLMPPPTASTADGRSPPRATASSATA